MSDVERTLGRVEQKIDSHTLFERTEHAKIDARFNTLETKVDSLRIWKAQVMAVKATILMVAGTVGGVIGYALAAWKAFRAGT